MIERSILSFFRVKVLTLGSVFLLTGCAFQPNWPWAKNPYYPEQCKTHAYISNGVQTHITRRFLPNSPVRIAVIPFSVPANATFQNADQPGIGNQLAWAVQAQLIRYGELPIVEVFNRQDWPGKKDEFFTGNFGAIAMAREAGYDMVLVGLVEPIRSIDTMTAYSKLIEAESGITVWYGQTAVSTPRIDRDKMRASWQPNLIDRRDDRRPDLLFNREIVDTLAMCLADGVMAEP